MKKQIKSVMALLMAGMLTACGSSGASESPAKTPDTEAPSAAEAGTQDAGTERYGHGRLFR